MKYIKQVEENKVPLSVIGIRWVQAVLMGITCLGISTGIADYSSSINLIFSRMTVVSVVFGSSGMIMTEIFVRILQKK